jgi:periplasmic protein TonB
MERYALNARSWMQACLIARAHPRLNAALAISMMLHAAVASMMTGGHVGSAPLAESQPMLSVRLVEPALRDVPPGSWLSEEPTATAAPDPQPSPRSYAKLQSAIAPTFVARSVESPTGSGAAVEGPDLNYYSAQQLDVYPALASEIELRSLGDTAAGSSTRAQFLLLIDEAGVVNEAGVVEGKPAIRFEHARLAFLAARFTPAYRNGRAVRSRVLVEVNY